MTTSDLIAFLLAQYDEEERQARACIAEVGPLRAGQPYPDGSGVADRDDFPQYPWGSDAAELAYMAEAGHPDRRLADIAAKRRLLDEVVEEANDTDSALDSEFRSTPRDPSKEPYLGDKILRLMALPYAGRPDWQEEWLP